MNIAQKKASFSIKRMFLAPDGRLHLIWRLLLGCLTFVCALELGLFVRSLFPRSSGDLAAVGLTIEDFIKALVAASFLIIAVYLLRRYVDRRPWNTLGLISPLKGLPFLLLGGLFTLLTAGLVLGLFLALGWVRIIAFQPDLFVLLIVVLKQCTITFLYEPLPEELLFRGYLYRNLNSRLPHYLAVPAQVVLFVSTALSLFAVEWIVRGSAQIAFGGPLNYVLTLVPFAFALQLARIFSGNLWTCIGIHLMTLTAQGYIFATQEFALVRVAYQPGFEQLGNLYAALYSVLGCILLLGWQFLWKRQFNWREQISA
ncbi:CPBP family intramembrane metalloprotease [Ktedonosporobacter rubrisoli]|uniref:CPBP family intramembrane metalloprotease n=1 Tax=Ktedonosporobacter rubrisoli TaxID=2509675 RepID=A0A4P6K1X8_KTERU|nr:CPBP family intramembrane glutamic endopeptidase [Ktedonosporobacter rubrisoli]QBD81476.1 CPBP family intramembrane metalloprotease [Ktedonosporobacter rubrisoli]